MTESDTHPWDHAGGPAFPTSCGNSSFKGMTLRDYFAAKAITGTLPGAAIDDNRVAEYAQWAYRMADAMLAERDKP